MRSMVSQEELDAIEARLGAASGDRWLLAHDDDGVAVVRVEHDEGTSSELPVMRDLDPASEADVAFVAHSRGDAERLTAAVRDGG
jgi:hypothetical protein